MAKNKNPNPSTIDSKLSAAEVRDIILKAAEKHNLGFLPVTGRTFTIRRVIWTNGGRWNKDSKCWEVPSQKHEAMQKLADEVTAKIEASMAASAEKKAKASAPAVDETPVEAETAYCAD